MEISTAAMLVLLAAILVVLIWLGLRLRNLDSRQNDNRLELAVETLKGDLLTRQTESIFSLRDSIDSANKIINDRLAEGTSSLDRRMSVLGDLENRLGQLSKQASDIEAVGANVQKLSELLRPPKLRGNVGELLLDNILAQILPQAMYHSQYRFETGLRVDAAIELGDRLMPIDAKFPIEAYERVSQEPENPDLQREFSRDFKKHIDAIADKYIRPSEKTTDFAVMYIPAEAVYYQLIAQQNQEGFEYALSRRVIPSSPGHLYAFLSSVAMVGAEISLAGSGLAEGGRRFLAGLNELAETTDRLARFHEKMESSLRALSAGFGRARTELSEARLQLEKLREPLSGKPMEDVDATLEKVRGRVE